MLLSSAIAAGGVSNGYSQTTIDLSLQNGFPLAEFGFVTTVPNGTGGTQDGVHYFDLIGLYSFSVGNSGDTQIQDGTTLIGTILSPSGTLSFGTHTYAEETFNQANPGYNPKAWSTDGIYNASYLWQQFSKNVIASGSANQGAALTLAMWDILYNSTGFGTLASNGGQTAAAVSSGSSSGYQITMWGGDGTVQTWYDTFVGAVDDSAQGNASAGTVLRDASYALGGHRGLNSGPSDPEASVDMLFTTVPVPEPTTCLAGAFLLIPVGIQVYRSLRNRKQTA